MILNWNGLVETLQCLESVQRLRYENPHVLVVDNGSASSEADTIATRFPDVSVVRNSINLGYAGGNNVGIRHALGQGADYVWLLNNDSTVHEESLSALIAAGEANPHVGLLSPMVHEHEAPRRVQLSGTVVDEVAELHHTLRSLEETRAVSGRRPLLLWGTALLIRRAVVEAIGLLDERYFAYHEDMDYCLRALARKFETMVVPDAVVFHVGSSESPLKEYLMVRNWYLLWRTYLTGWTRRTYPPRYLAWVLERALNAKREGKQLLAEHALDGAWDALRGHSGPWDARGHMPRLLRRFVVDGVLAWHPPLWIMLLAGSGRLAMLRAVRRILR